MLTLAKWLLGIDCVLLITVVLLQSGRSAGLSGAISGTEQIVGRKARGIDAVLGRVTAIAAFLFMGLALWVAWLISHAH